MLLLYVQMPYFNLLWLNRIINCCFFFSLTIYDIKLCNVLVIYDSALPLGANAYPSFRCYKIFWHLPLSVLPQRQKNKKGVSIFFSPPSGCQKSIPDENISAPPVPFKEINLSLMKKTLYSLLKLLYCKYVVE